VGTLPTALFFLVSHVACEFWRSGVRRNSDTVRAALKRIEREACARWMDAMAARQAGHINTETEHELKQAHFNALSALLDYDVRLIRACGVY